MVALFLFILLFSRVIFFPVAIFKHYWPLCKVGNIVGDSHAILADSVVL